mmetsp:Transcript_31566/g.73558  ORF Transcript_31566/g.73558 Transcript_31566/m.73558 type:complete len:245 (+) Transcript_31566:322-1056(+)
MSPSVWRRRRPSWMLSCRPCVISSGIPCSPASTSSSLPECCLTTMPASPPTLYPRAAPSTCCRLRSSPTPRARSRRSPRRKVQPRSARERAGDWVGRANARLGAGRARLRVLLRRLSASSGGRRPCGSSQWLARAPDLGGAARRPLQPAAAAITGRQRAGQRGRRAFPATRAHAVHPESGWRRPPLEPAPRTSTRRHCRAARATLAGRADARAAHGLSQQANRSQARRGGLFARYCGWCGCDRS